MNNRLIPLALLAGAFLFSTTLGAAASQRTVEIVNNTGHVIVEFYGSSAGSREWEEDILGQDTLGQNESVEIDFDDSTGHCIFDFKVVFDDGDILIRENLDVCTLETFTYE